MTLRGNKPPRRDRRRFPVARARAAPVWDSQRLAGRFATTELNLCRQLYQQDAGVVPDLGRRLGLHVLLPAIGGITGYMYGDVAKLPDHRQQCDG
mgnify:CR=1 FL=1